MHLEAAPVTLEQSDSCRNSAACIHDQYSAERDSLPRFIYQLILGGMGSNRLCERSFFPLSSFVSTPVKHL